MIGGGKRISEWGVALIDAVFLLGALALFVVLLLPRGPEENASGDRVTIGTEGEAVQP